MTRPSSPLSMLPDIQGGPLHTLPTGPRAPNRHFFGRHSISRTAVKTPNAIANPKRTTPHLRSFRTRRTIPSTAQITLLHGPLAKVLEVYVSRLIRADKLLDCANDRNYDLLLGDLGCVWAGRMLHPMNESIRLISREFVPDETK